MKKYIIFFLIILLPIEVSAAWSVWTEPMLADKPQPTYNPAKKPTNITLKGAKNEWVGFLVCVRGDETLNGFVPSISSTLTSGENTIANSNIIPYILFNHTTTERANTYEAPGDYPDAAVPYRDVYYNEIRDGVEAGWGQVVAANITRVFFVEVYIPTTAVKGTYSGLFTLTTNDGVLSQSIPISLDVSNFTLPEQWSLKNLWGVYGGYYLFSKTALGAIDSNKAREYLFNMQKAAINHGFFLYGTTGLLVSGPDTTGSFTNRYFDGTSDAFSWKRFLDGTVPQGYNPKPYPRTSIFGTKDESGGSLINKTTTTMDAWATWITSHGYDKQTLFIDKILDEPDMSSINAKHEAHVSRHQGYPDRPYEYWTAGVNSYPPNSVFWGDSFKSMWMVSQFYTWYKSHDFGNSYVPIGSPNDFDLRRATYGDLLFSYTAGDNDSACNIATYDPSRGIRTAASSSLDAYSRQNAYMFISDWKFKTIGHHFWIVNEGWQNNVFTTTADETGNFNVPINQSLDNGTYQIKAYWTKADTKTGTLGGSNIIVSSGSGVTSLTLPASGATVGQNITITGSALPGVHVSVLITGTAPVDSANRAWSTTDPFSDVKTSQGFGGVSVQGYNGDGVYFYPGRVSGTNYDIGGSHDIPIESYKMKLARWGAQVYEYAKLLESKGKKDIADYQIGKMITFNVPNTITIHSVQDWENARNTMGNEISYVEVPLNGTAIKPTIHNISPKK